MLQLLCCKSVCFICFHTYVAIVLSECCKNRSRCSVRELAREAWRHRLLSWPQRATSALSYVALEWVLIARLLNQWLARLRNRQARGLHRAQSGTSEGAYSRARAQVDAASEARMGAGAASGADAGAASRRRRPVRTSGLGSPLIICCCVSYSPWKLELYWVVGGNRIQKWKQSSQDHIQRFYGSNMKSVIKKPKKGV